MNVQPKKRWVKRQVLVGRVSAGSAGDGQTPMGLTEWPAGRLPTAKKSLFKEACPELGPLHLIALV